MSSSTIPEQPSLPSNSKPRKGSAFWLAFVAVVVSIFLSALDLTAVATILPTLTEDLNGGDDYVWVGSAYALASTAFLPLSGNFADIFGRRPVMMLSIVFFAVGSAVAGAAHSMGMMIAGRTIQGIGGGGIINLCEIITSDLVPLAERGLYQGIIVLTWSFASGVGPPIGGAFAAKASWRWLFYINLPLSGIAFVLVLFFLKIRTPEGSMSSKLARVDWIGNLIAITGITLSILGLTWGGVRFPWSSAQVLAPLIIGLTLVVCFIAFDARVPAHPTIPLDLLKDRTPVSAYIATTVHGVTSISILYYIPVYFQACLLASPLRSGVNMLATALVMAPFALFAGISVQVSNRYRPANVIGWVLSVIGFGLLSMLSADSSVGKWVGYQFVASAGAGMIYAATIFPILAPLPVERTAAALAFFAFVRAFAQAWGITISGTILQNELAKTLPPSFLALLPSSSHGGSGGGSAADIAYSAIPLIHTLPPDAQATVRAAFAHSLGIVWKTMIGVAGGGLLTVVFLKEIEMKKHTDEKFGLEEEERIRAGGAGEEGEKEEVAAPA